jgi:hypothetical protein
MGVLVLVVGGVVIIIGVIGGISVLRSHCGRVRRAYESDPAGATLLYGAASYAAWHAAQPWWVRIVC